MIPEGLKEQLRKHEGLRLTVYQCTGHANTIGYGHNIDAHPLPDVIAHHLDVFGSITLEMAEQLLDQDIEQAVTDCHRLYPDFDKFSERRQWAMIDFIFNLGLSAARSFYNTNRAVNRQDWEGAAKGMQNSLWYRQVSSRGATIVEMVKNG